ncbi:MAG: family transcriptional regulator, regulator of embCAB operon, partial [Pseudonocardiales bacterium]|nr:family transcriptional regulator, regulator of embCAB operon [Pseudonocardiales bacterium]
MPSVAVVTTGDEASAGLIAPAEPASPDAGGLSVRVGLLGGFGLTVGAEAVGVSPRAERLVAFIALSGQSVPRSVIAGTMWPNVPESRAYASLRSTLRRLTGLSRRALTVGPGHVGLAPGVGVDLHEARSVARGILDPGTGSLWPARDGAIVARLSGELLPGWYEDWALVEAEEWRQLRLHALETLAGEFITAGHFADAVAAGGAAVRGEPLRESAHAVLIGAH